MSAFPGAEERAAEGPVLRKGVDGPGAWFDPRDRALGHRAFVLNRITGLGLVFYLYLHLGVLSMLLRGEAAWSGFLRLATTTAFLGLDVLLLAGLLYHGLNGVRVALVGTGILRDRQRALWWSAAIVMAFLLVWGAVRLWGQG